MLAFTISSKYPSGSLFFYTSSLFSKTQPIILADILSVTLIRRGGKFGYYHRSASDILPGNYFKTANIQVIGRKNPLDLVVCYTDQGFDRNRKKTFDVVAGKTLDSNKAN